MDPIAKIQTVVAGVRNDVETLATESEALQSAVETLRERSEEPGFRAILPAAFEDEVALPLAPRVPVKPRRSPTATKVLRLFEHVRVVLTGGSRPGQPTGGRTAIQHPPSIPDR